VVALASGCTPPDPGQLPSHEPEQLERSVVLTTPVPGIEPIDVRASSGSEHSPAVATVRSRVADGRDPVDAFVALASAARDEGVEWWKATCSFGLSLRGEEAIDGER